VIYLGLVHDKFCEWPVPRVLHDEEWCGYFLKIFSLFSHDAQWVSRGYIMGIRGGGKKKLKIDSGS
jgi:hypothetical protein